MFKKINLLIFIFCLMQIWSAKHLLSQSGWQIQNHSFTNQSAVVDVFFFDANTGWVCGQFGFLFKTTNGGLNWNHFNLSNNYNFNALCFINQNTGWIGLGTYISSQYRGLIINTTNGGSNWKIDTLSEEGNIPDDVTFYNSQTGWIAAKGIYKTTNSGTNWTRYFIQGFQNYTIRSVSFPNSITGYCCGSFYNQLNNKVIDIIAKSINGGINWSIIKIDTSSIGFYKFYRDIQFLNVNTGFQCASQPIKTTNGGNSWFDILEYGPYYSMHFIDENTGWFGKWDNTVMTSNGGANWQIQPLPISALFHGIYFINNLTGWGVGLNSGVTYPKIFKTVSGGFTSINIINSEVPQHFSLSQNYPNPFNPSTNIKFQIPHSGFVKLTVFDLLGREIENLVNQQLSPGTYKVDFDGTSLPSGVYYFKIEASDYKETKKMVLIK